MKERPMLFSAPMVRAILAGTKTQTRRVVKPGSWNPAASDYTGAVRVGQSSDSRIGLQAYFEHRDSETWHETRCPYGQPGDRLWVRETWQAVSGTDRARRIVWSPRPSFGWVEYAASPIDEAPPRWRPSIHMPRWASRITLEITAVRVERLQDISEADAIAEGVDRFPGCRQDDDAAAFNRIGPVDNDSFPIARYAVLWEQINGPGSWDANPWVWVVEFKRSATT